MAAIHSKCSDYSAVDDGQSSEVSGGGGGGGEGFMLFGVRVMEEGSFRKSASMNNLAQFEQIQDSNNDAGAGYASDGDVHPPGRSRDRKRGVPWSEEEHRLFLLGLQTVGKGDWRGISRNFVKTRTPTQVASHAQKYFLRRNNHNRRRRRSSLFDITTDSVVGSANEDQMHQEILLPQPPIIHQQNLTNNVENFPITSIMNIQPITNENSIQNHLTLGQVNHLNNSPNPIRPIPILPIPSSSKMANLTLDPPSLSLNLSIQPSAPPANQQLPPGRRSSGFQTRPSGLNESGGDSIISVA